MKSSIKPMIISGSVILITTLLFSTLFATLYYFHVLPMDSFIIANCIVGIIAYALGGITLGEFIEGKVLIHALICMIPFIILGIIFLLDGTPLAWEMFIAKLLTFIMLSIFVFNLKKPV